jgi:hypothetical protein
MIEENVRETIYQFLDNLRESGACNMYEAPKYVQEVYGLSRYESRDVVKDWMKSFASRQVVA